MQPRALPGCDITSSETLSSPGNLNKSPRICQGSVGNPKTNWYAYCNHKCTTGRNLELAASSSQTRTGKWTCLWKEAEFQHFLIWQAGPQQMCLGPMLYGALTVVLQTICFTMACHGYLIQRILGMVVCCGCSEFPFKDPSSLWWGGMFVKPVEVCNGDMALEFMRKEPSIKAAEWLRLQKRQEDTQGRENVWPCWLHLQF